VDVVLLATATPDHPCPATAPVVASRLGLDGVGAYDISAVCSGFIYGLATACGLIGAGLAGSVLVIGADTYSTILDPTDRTTSVLFGDGAGAAVVCAGEPTQLGALGPFDLGSDGAGSELITVRGPGSRQRLSGSPAPAGSEYFSMAGQQVFWLAVRRMSGSAARVLAGAGWHRDEVDWLFCHQANIRIQHSLADAVQLPRSRCYSNIDLVGNTAAASIPLALDHAHSAGLLSPANGCC
jgi:3-oxoacyl-[acyl-carrier-protein] synthase-3